jgi:hypothetical protein
MDIMKKIILILFTAFCTNSFAGMYQKTQGNSQALPTNNVVTPIAQSVAINVNPSSINASGSAVLSVTGAQGAATYSVTSGSCTVSGSTITAGSSAGTCTVLASIPASTYFLASSATTTITINAPQNQVITSFYIEPNFLSLSTTTYLRVSGTNLGNVSFSVISGPCVLFQGNRLYSDSTGNCVIRATTAANGSYASTTQNLTITVTN